MRIWSLHPKYLDTKGLVALWRETLLAKHVLEGRTKGYTNHPQLIRFKNYENPLSAINFYLNEVRNEALARNYNFDKNKIGAFENSELEVTSGQIAYEIIHLKKKLEFRDLNKFHELNLLEEVELHPIFKMIPGEIEPWEII